MLHTLRRASQHLFFKAILIAIVLSFILWGVGDILRANHSNAIATVGDQTISQEIFQRRLNDETQRLQSAFGGKLSPEHLRAFGLQENILNQMIAQTLISNRLSDLKIFVSENSIYKSIAKYEAFQDEKGNFSAELFRKALKENGMSEKQFIIDVTNSIREALLIRSIIASVKISDKEAELIANAQQEKRLVNVFFIPANSISAIADPSDSVLQDFYQKNSQKFIVPEHRNARFLVIKPELVKLSENFDASVLQQRYENEKDRFAIPERRIIEHRVFDSEEAAKKFHATLAKNELTSLGKNAISIEESAIATLPEDLQQKVFALAPKTASEVVSSPLGWHVFLVTKIEKAGFKSFAEVREQIKNEMKEQQVSEGFLSLTQTAEELLAKGSSLEQVAKEIGGTVVSVSNLSKNEQTAADEKSDKPAHDPAVLKAIFETTKGQVSPLVNLASVPNNVALVAVDEVQDERVKALDEVRGMAISLWKEDEKHRLLKIKANEFLKLATEKNANIESLAQSKGLQITRSITISHPIKQKSENPEKKTATKILPASLENDIFSLPLKKISNPHLNADGGYVFAVAEKIIGQNASAEQIANAKNAIEQANPEEAASYYQQYLQKIYPIKINQAILNNSQL